MYSGLDNKECLLAWGHYDIRLGQLVDLPLAQLGQYSKCYPGQESDVFTILESALQHDFCADTCSSTTNVGLIINSNLYQCFLINNCLYSCHCCTETYFSITNISFIIHLFL